MRKIIRLTESDLTRIVRRVIKENDAIEKNVIYEAPTATPTPTPVAKPAATPVQVTFNCKYNQKVDVGTVYGSLTKLPTGVFKASDYITVMIGKQTIARLKLNTTNLVYEFDKYFKTPGGVAVENMDIAILAPKKPSTAISEVIGLMNKSTGSNLSLSLNVRNAFNKIRTGVSQNAKAPMPRILSPLGDKANMFRLFDPETKAILKTELWLGNTNYYDYVKDNGVIVGTGGSRSLISRFKDNPKLAAAIEQYNDNRAGFRAMFDQLWDTLEANLA